MTATGLKVIACITMFIDHYAMVFVDESTTAHVVMRIIGRMAFPIFAYLIAEGFFHTRHIHKYLARLLIFAFISEIPYDMAQGVDVGFGSLNIFFTLFLGLLVIHLYHHIKNKKIGLVIVLLIGFISGLAEMDYAIYGIMTIFFFYHYRGHFQKQAISFGGMTALFVGLGFLGNTTIDIRMFVQLFAIISLGFIYFYNGKKGKSMRYLFYLFYPGHLLILGLVRMYLAS
ncbi:hypothetical protein HZI73_19365 [Vallitalea pronyensis]|uniref:Conjugal transfer protein TraX n=1 Tax=Vallitalea pronyensis TaxID=1348613 RepID=A0A8J8MMT1_9FIRM|nr:TraX family protein [Vallitalea pronyensis]QUI24322.1 hypothetical protein HZI73_19365 [Vallitalea pronyensis]